MAAVVFNTVSISSKPVAFFTGRYKSQHYAYSLARVPSFSHARFRLNAVPRAHKFVSVRRRRIKIAYGTAPSKGGGAEVESPEEQEDTEEVSALASASKGGDAEIDSPAEQQKPELVSDTKLASKNGDAEFKFSAEEKKPRGGLSYAIGFEGG